MGGEKYSRGGLDKPVMLGTFNYVCGSLIKRSYLYTLYFLEISLELGQRLSLYGHAFDIWYVGILSLVYFCFDALRTCQSLKQIPKNLV